MFRDVDDKIFYVVYEGQPRHSSCFLLCTVLKSESRWNCRRRKSRFDREIFPVVVIIPWKEISDEKSLVDDWLMIIIRRSQTAEKARSKFAY